MGRATRGKTHQSGDHHILERSLQRGTVLSTRRHLYGQQAMEWPIQALDSLSRYRCPTSRPSASGRPLQIQINGKTSHIPTRRSTMGCWATGSRRPKWGSLDQVMIRNRHHHHANDLLKRSSIIVAVKRRGSHPRRCRAHLALVRRLSADRLCGRAACCCISSERRRASEAAM